MYRKWKSASAGLLASACCFVLGSPPADAYSGPEHTQISDLGLWVAYEDQCRYALMVEPACAAARELLASPCPEEACGHQEKRTYLGGFTRAADFFTRSERIVADPEGCRDKKEETCWKDLFRDCSPLSAACYQKVVENSEQKIFRRQRWFNAPLRIAATHRNKNHFREFAGNQYNALHLRAVGLARSGHFELALRTEGVALHFLQDLFAPGHLASARADFSDAASGSFHDRFNRKGLPFRVVPSPSWCTVLNTFEASLEGDKGAHFRLQPPPAARALRIDSADLRSFGEALGGCRPGEEGATKPLDYQAVGDGRLLDRAGLSRDGRMHRIFLVLASAWSIRQVLLANVDDDLLQICFQHQSARVQGGVSGERRPSLDQPDIETFWAPGAVLTQKRHLPLDPECDICQPDLEGSLAGYMTSIDRRTEFRSLTDPFPSISVAEAAWSPLRWGESNGGFPTASRWELGWTFFGQVPDSEVVQRDEMDRVLKADGVERRFTLEGLKRPLPLSWTLAVHHEEHQEFDVWGSGLLINIHGNLGSTLWNIYGIVEPGYALYRNEAREAWRWRASGRVGIGYGVLFFEVGAERGFALDSTGDGHREWRYFAGPRIRLPTSWRSRLSRR